MAGRPIPGSRWGIDNPDSVYRVIPISGDERYEIRGRVGEHRMTENYFTLWDANMGTVGVLNGRTMEVDADGSFVITVDSDPAGGRPNHVQSTPEAHEFYIRDVLLDWDRDDPNHLTVQRLGAPRRRRRPRTLDEQADATAAMMAYFADFTGKLSHGVYKMAPNHFNLAWSADQVGAMRNQVYVMGRFDLNPDEAFVVDVSDGGAEYFTVPLSNIWGTTLDIVDRTGSLNKAQSVPNEDGTYTYVISPTDPGVANWIDSDGLNEGILTLRMAEFGGDGPKEDLGARGRVVKLDDLDTEVPDAAPGVRRRSGRPNWPTAERRTCAACPKGRTDMGRWLITGCSTGIGREIARAALEAGHSVVVTARRTETVADFVDDFGDRAVAVALDVTDKGQIAAAVARGRGRVRRDRRAGQQRRLRLPVRGRGGRGRRGPEAVRHQLLRRRRHDQGGAARRCAAAQSGHIVNISSMTGLVANPPNAYYSSTKFALEALTEALAQEVKPLGIKVTAIEPGAFRTDWAARSM